MLCSVFQYMIAISTIVAKSKAFSQQVGEKGDNRNLRIPVSLKSLRGPSIAMAARSVFAVSDSKPLL